MLGEKIQMRDSGLSLSTRGYFKSSDVKVWSFKFHFLFFAETKKTKATISDISALQSPAANLLDAASQGLHFILHLAINRASAEKKV